MTTRLVATYVVLAAIVLAVLEIPLAVIHQSRLRHDLGQRVERDAVALSALVEDDLQEARPLSRARIGDIATGYARQTGVRVVVVDAGGTLVVDSDDSSPAPREFRSRPEIARALSGQVATGERHSRTLGTDLMYVAVPVASGGRVYGAVRATVPTSRVDAQARRYRLVLAGVAAGVLAVVALAGWSIARWVATPLLDLRRSARVVAGGDLTERAADDAGPPEVRELARAFNDMVTRLQQTVGAQEQFVADASHQLRSPLTALRLRIENLQYEVDEAARDDADAALGEVDRLTRLVNGLLTLARADRRAHDRAPRDVAGIARERVDAWRLVAEDQGVELALDASGALRAPLADGALEQVLDNLIANALEVAPPGSRVDVAAAEHADGVVVTVADRGPGMDAESRAHAFDRFWSGRPERTGSGLGLAIVKRLVEADGGDVELDENPGGGLRARVTLPHA